MTGKTYVCKVCSIDLYDSSTYKRHIKTKKHISKTSGNEKLCDTCKTLFQNDTTFDEHIASCCYRKCNVCNKYCKSLSEYNNHNCYKQLITNDNVVLSLENIVKQTVNNMMANTEVLDKLCEKVGEKVGEKIGEKVEDKVTDVIDRVNKLEKKNNKIDKEVRSHRKALLTILNDKHRDNPMLTTPDIDEYITALEQYYGAKNNSTHDLQKKILNKYRDNFTIVDELVDVVCLLVKKDDLNKQSVFNSDMSRCNYATKLHQKIWSTDAAGEKLLDTIIEPLINSMINILNIYRRYLSKINTRFENNKIRKIKQTDEQIDEPKKYGLILNSLIIMLEDDDMMDKDNKLRLTKMIVKELCSRLRYDEIKCLEYYRS